MIVVQKILSYKEVRTVFMPTLELQTRLLEKDPRTGSSKRFQSTSTKLVKLTDEELSRLARRMNLPTAGS
jgi:hypothetical protein